jgi:uncharacterized membrane protein YjjB (DUF3815 family)
MTKRQLKIGAIIAGVGLGIWWLLRKNSSTTPAVTTATGTVTVGVPTVTGSGSTGDDYLTPQTSLNYPGKTLPANPDYYNPDGTPGYYLR